MAKLYCILARSAKIGVIFRRGPSKQVRLIRWDLKKHTFEPGQWFKGRIYERKCDLSPNGKKLVYFAAKFRGNPRTWIAVSNPPFLKAIVLWPAIGTWNDLSVFEDNSVLGLATYRSDSDMTPLEGFSIPRSLTVKQKPWSGRFYRLADHERMLRDGWKVASGDPVFRPSISSESLVYRKPLFSKAGLVSLEMRTRGEESISYCINQEGGALELRADWAEVRGNDVFYSHGGRLLRIGLKLRQRRLVVGDPDLLADFSDMAFEAIEAPARATRW